MGDTRGFRQAVSRRTGGNQPHGSLERNPVTYGYINRLNPCLGAHCRPDHFLAFFQGNQTSFFTRQLAVPANEQGLTYSDRGLIQQHSEMAGNAKTARMSNPMTIADNDIG